uniref:Uncharacterized protein n=1 Tax=Favella ehrenbergii TaxID=182087 RepID=A0A7S3I075_9SPIT
MLVLRLLLLVFLIKVHNRLELILSLLLRQNEFVDEPVFADHDALLIDDVIELAVVFLKNVIFIILLVLIVLKVVLASVAIVALDVVAVLTLPVFPLEHIRLTLAFFLAMLVVQLLQDVLNLPFELVVNLVHQILEHFEHAELFGLLAELLAREN